MPEADPKPHHPKKRSISRYFLDLVGTYEMAAVLLQVCNRRRDSVLCFCCNAQQCHIRNRCFSLEGAR